MSELSPEAQEYRALQEAEYSQYVATDRIYIGGALAFLPGHPVPKSHLDRKVVNSKQVKKADSKTAPNAPKGDSA